MFMDYDSHNVKPMYHILPKDMKLYQVEFTHERTADYYTAVILKCPDDMAEWTFKHVVGIATTVDYRVRHRVHPERRELVLKVPNSNLYAFVSDLSALLKHRL